jgi:pyruvate/2-oxoglutarate dehydrogenase complex dihydrolipoamide acyltransferase (E2) component
MSRFKREKKLSSWRRISLSAWDRPRDPSVYGWLSLDVSLALAYLERLERETGTKLTLTHLVGKALAVAIGACPEVNAVVRRGRQVYTRQSVDVFFQVVFDEGNLSGAKVQGADAKSLVEIAAELGQRAATIRQKQPHELSRSDATLERLPALIRRSVLRGIEAAVYDWGIDLRRFGVPEDGFGSAMVTNVGVFGLPHGLAPLVPFARVPIVLTVGALADAPVAENGQVVVRPVLPVGVTLDHRILDGYQAGKLARRFIAVMQDPARELGAPHVV